MVKTYINKYKMDLKEILNRPKIDGGFEDYEFSVFESSYLVINSSHINDEEDVQILLSFFITSKKDWEAWENSEFSHIIIDDFGDSFLKIPVSDLRELVDDEDNFDSKDLFFHSITECKIIDGKKIFHNKNDRSIQLTNWGEDLIAIEIQEFLAKTWATYRGKEAEGLKIFECDDNIHGFRVNIEVDEEGFVDFTYLTYELTNKKDSGTIFFGTMDYYMSEMF